jgi:hypothetical protein
MGKVKRPITPNDVVINIGRMHQFMNVLFLAKGIIVRKLLGESSSRKMNPAS